MLLKNQVVAMHDFIICRFGEHRPHLRGLLAADRFDLGGAVIGQSSCDQPAIAAGNADHITAIKFADDFLDSRGQQALIFFDQSADRTVINENGSLRSR